MAYLNRIAWFGRSRTGQQAGAPNTKMMKASVGHDDEGQ